MITYYCPRCWTAVAETDRTCPNCGYALENFQDLAYEDKLLAALHHSVPERRMMAAQILGNLKSRRALAVFSKIVTGGETDYYFLKMILLAVVKVDDPLRDKILEEASRHSSTLVSSLAKELIRDLSLGKEHSKWDRDTG